MVPPGHSDVTIEYPQIIKAGAERNWAWLAHGRNNSTLQAGMPADDERAYLANVVETIEQATGSRPRGWLGPHSPRRSRRRGCSPNSA